MREAGSPTMAEEDELLFVDEDEPKDKPKTKGKWKVAVIDDEPAVHDATRFALYDYVLGGQGIELLSAFSSVEARDLLRAHPDIAVILLDVVMETDTAGLDLVSYIRRDLKNETVRIILRTGQPGQAPERKVILDYDINDYKSKTELTAAKLFTSLTAAMRSYQQLLRMVETRRGLEIIIEATATLGDFRSIQRLAEGILMQVASLLAVDCPGVLVLREDSRRDGPFSVLAASGCYSDLVGRKAGDHLAPDLVDLIDAAFSKRQTIYLPERTVLYIGTESGTELVVLLDSGKELSDTDRTLIEVFCSRLSVCVDKVLLYEQLQEANLTLERRVAMRTEELAAANRRLNDEWQRAKRGKARQSEILGTVAHDLRNPLGVVLGRTEILQTLIEKQPFAVDAGLAQVEQIRKSAVHLTEMANVLVQDAATDALDVSIRRERGDLTALINEIAAANQPLAERKQQVVSIEAVDSLPAEFDYGRMRDALDNLLSNAIKYSFIGGRIVVSLVREGDQAVIRVADKGPGLHPEDYGRIFGRFQRLTAKPTGGEASTGLGLSIAKRVVDLHNGEITADSPARALAPPSRSGSRFAATPRDRRSRSPRLEDHRSAHADLCVDDQVRATIRPGVDRSALFGPVCLRQEVDLVEKVPAERVHLEACNGLPRCHQHGRMGDRYPRRLVVHDGLRLAVEGVARRAIGEELGPGYQRVVGGVAPFRDVVAAGLRRRGSRAALPRKLSGSPLSLVQPYKAMGCPPACTPVAVVAPGRRHEMCPDADPGEVLRDHLGHALAVRVVGRG